MRLRRRYRDDSRPTLRCFGQPVSRNEAACLVLCGWAVVVLNLHASGVPLYLLPPQWLM